MEDVSAPKALQDLAIHLDAAVCVSADWENSISETCFREWLQESERAASKQLKPGLGT